MARGRLLVGSQLLSDEDRSDRLWAACQGARHACAGCRSFCGKCVSCARAAVEVGRTWDALGPAGRERFRKFFVVRVPFRDCKWLAAGEQLVDFEELTAGAICKDTALEIGIERSQFSRVLAALEGSVPQTRARGWFASADAESLALAVHVPPDVWQTLKGSVRRAGSGASARETNGEPGLQAVQQARVGLLSALDGFWRSRLVLDVEILGVEVYDKGLALLPSSCDSLPIAVSPQIEVVGFGQIKTTSKGIPVVSVSGIQWRGADVRWGTFTFGDGPARLQVFGDGCLRFRVLLIDEAASVGSPALAFTSTTRLDADYFLHGCPSSLCRPLRARVKNGESSVVGYVHSRISAVHVVREGEDARATTTCSWQSPSGQVLCVPGDYATVQAAVDAVPPLLSDIIRGAVTRVVLGPGGHPGSVRLHKPVVLQGRPDAWIEGSISVVHGGELAELRDLTVRGSISVMTGAPLITGCTVSGARIGPRPPASSFDQSVTLGGIDVVGFGSAPRIERNVVRGCEGVGISVRGGAIGTYWHNDLCSNALHGVALQHTGTSPCFRDNRINTNRGFGVLVGAGAGGEFCENELSQNAFGGVQVQDPGSCPMFESNYMLRNEEAAVRVTSGASGAFRRNNFGNNALHGVVVEDPCTNPFFESNRMQDNLYGVSVTSGAAGNFLTNEVSDNSLSGVEVHGKGSSPIFERNNIYRNKRAGFFVLGGAAGTYTKNNVRANSLSGVVLQGVDTNPAFVCNFVHDNLRSGIYCAFSSGGCFKDNEICNNMLSGIVVRDKGTVTAFHRNRLHGNRHAGISVLNGASGSFSENEVRGTISVAGVEAEIVLNVRDV